jgi:hypothetical protein
MRKARGHVVVRGHPANLGLAVHRCTGISRGPEAVKVTMDEKLIDLCGPPDRNGPDVNGIGYRHRADDSAPTIRLKAWTQTDISLLRQANMPR